MSLLVAQYPISCAEGVPEIWYIPLNLRVVFCRNGMCWTIRGSYMLSEALSLIIISFEKNTNHLEYQFMFFTQCFISFAELTGCHIFMNVWYLIIFGQKCHNVDHKGCIYAIRISFSHHHTSKEGEEILNQPCIILLAVQCPIFCPERMLIMFHLYIWLMSVIRAAEMIVSWVVLMFGYMPVSWVEMMGASVAQ